MVSEDLVPAVGNTRDRTKGQKEHSFLDCCSTVSGQVPKCRHDPSVDTDMYSVGTQIQKWVLESKLVVVVLQVLYSSVQSSKRILLLRPSFQHLTLDHHLQTHVGIVERTCCRRQNQGVMQNGCVCLFAQVSQSNIRSF